MSVWKKGHKLGESIELPLPNWEWCGLAEVYDIPMVHETEVVPHMSIKPQTKTRIE